MIAETIFGKIGELVVGETFRNVKGRRQRRQAFEAHKRRIAHINVTNEITGALRQFRAFLIEQDLLRVKSISLFAEKWLNHPRVLFGANSPNALSAAEISAMKAELQALEI